MLDILYENLHQSFCVPTMDILSNFSLLTHTKSSYSSHPSIKDMCLKYPHSPHAIEMLADVYKEENNFTGANACYDTLKSIDPVRVLYWAFIQNQIKK